MDRRRVCRYLAISSLLVNQASPSTHRAVFVVTSLFVYIRTIVVHDHYATFSSFLKIAFTDPTFSQRHDANARAKRNKNSERLHFFLEFLAPHMHRSKHQRPRHPCHRLLSKLASDPAPRSMPQWMTMSPLKSAERHTAQAKPTAAQPRWHDEPGEVPVR